MTVKRRFLIASSMARLLRKERGAKPVIEAHYAPSDGRNAYVLFENGKCELILFTTEPNGEVVEERTEVPARQGKFLVDTSAGTIGYNRVQVDLGGREFRINCFTTPAPFGIAELEFDVHEEAATFAAPAWFGPEITDEPAYEHQAMALAGLTAPPDVPVSDLGLHSLLDLLEMSNMGLALQPAARPVTRFPRAATSRDEGAAVSESRS